MPTEAAKLARLEAHIEAVEARLADIEGDRKSMFRWGMMALGSLVTAAIGFLFRDQIK